MIDIDVEEFSTQVYPSFDFDLCRDALIDFYLLATNNTQVRYAVGLKHSGLESDWLAQTRDGSYGSHLRYGSLMTETTPLTSDAAQVKDPGIFSQWNSKFHHLYPEVTAEFDRVAPDIRRPKIASIGAGTCLPLHVDLVHTKAYHLCVVSNAQTFFVVGNKFLRMLPGKWYEFNPNIPHAIINLGTTDIYHVLARAADPVTAEDLITCQDRELEIIAEFFQSFHHRRDVLLHMSRIKHVIQYYLSYCQRTNLAADLLTLNPLISEIAHESSDHAER